MKTLDSLLSKSPKPLRLWSMWLIMALLTAALAWAYSARLEEVTVAMGTVAPSGNIKTIQHLEGGIVEAIHVEEGQIVKTGMPLVKLGLGLQSSRDDEIEARVAGLIMTRARLQAEMSGNPPQFDMALAAKYPKMAEAEMRALEQRNRTLSLTETMYQKKMKSRQDGINEVNQRLKATRRNLKLAREQMTLSERLATQNLIPKLDLLEIKRQVATLEGEEQGLMAQLPQLRSEIEEIRSEKDGHFSNFQGDSAARLSEVEREIAQLQEQLVASTDQTKRSVITSPIDGIVKRMAIHTVGGVIRPGDPIMEIVPTQDKLVVRAQITPMDIGHIKVGQAAEVKITAYDFVRYGALNGTVTDLAADAEQDPEGNYFFRAVIETDQASLTPKFGGSFPIIAGMQASVDIKTGSKSVLEYLIQPVLKVSSEAFRER